MHSDNQESGEEPEPASIGPARNGSAQGNLPSKLFPNVNRSVNRKPEIATVQPRPPPFQFAGVLWPYARGPPLKAESVW